MIIVSDTSVLSNLAVIEQLPLLQQLYNKVIIPQAVRNELSNASPELQEEYRYKKPLPRCERQEIRARK